MPRPNQGWQRLTRLAKTATEPLLISVGCVKHTDEIIRWHFKRRAELVKRLGELEANVVGTLAPFVRFLDVKRCQGGSGWAEKSPLDVVDQVSSGGTDYSLRMADWSAAQELLERASPKERSIREMANIPSYTEIAMGLAEALNVLDEALDMEDTACDHSVGICWCDFHERRSKLIALAKKAGV